ncbi:MAG: helix-turn-helix domain-containing protein [Solirubrobacteraceae bacterium]|nr:helix-turn-helix domain-containing protein [Patulibacter sp.]
MSDTRDATPDRSDWPVATPSTPEGLALTELILATFRVHGQLMDAAQRLAAAGGITAAWWQVLGGVLDGPLTVAGIARRMGMSRQGVQRVADLLVDRGLAEYRDNPDHRRSRLLACTEAGYHAVRLVSVAQHPWAAEIGDTVGADRLREATATLERLSAVLDG